VARRIDMWVADDGTTHATEAQAEAHDQTDALTVLIRQSKLADCVKTDAAFIARFIVASVMDARLQRDVPEIDRG